jgi:hypothetical protein
MTAALRSKNFIEPGVSDTTRLEKWFAFGSQFLTPVKSMASTRAILL